MRLRGPDKITPNATWSAGGSSTIQFPYLTYWMTGFLLRLDITKTDAAPAPNEDWIGRLITSLSLTVGGTEYLTVGAPDIRMLLHAIRLRMAGGWRMMPYPAGNNTTVVVIPVHFGLAPTLTDGRINFDDASVAIPPSQALALNLSWPAATAAGTGITITGITANALPYGVIPESSAEYPRYRPNWFTSSPTISGVQSGLGLVENLALGAIYRATTWGFFNGAAPADNRNDGLAGAAVSEMQVSFVPPAGGLQEILHADVAVLSRIASFVNPVQDDNAGVPSAALVGSTASIAAVHNPGIARINWYERQSWRARAAADAVYGMDLRQGAPNGVQVAYTVDNATNTSIREFHEGYLQNAA